MVFALYIVALAMVAGGLSAIYLGSDIIVMERGWTMVISGAVIAAAGALLAGVATAVARLQAIESEFAGLRERLSRLDADIAPSFLTRTRPAAPVQDTSPPATSATAARDFGITPELRPAAPPAAPTSEPAPGAPAAARPSAAAAQPAAAARQVEAALIEAEGGKMAADDRAAAAPSAAEAETPEEPTVVGTYNSGGNFYIMYSDGAIEAETPSGKFRFTSLDELKDFIAAGGDKAKAVRPA